VHDLLFVATPVAQERRSFGPAVVHRHVTERGIVVVTLRRDAPHIFKPLLKVAGERDVLVVSQVERPSCRGPASVMQAWTCTRERLAFIDSDFPMPDEICICCGDLTRLRRVVDGGVTETKIARCQPS